MPDKPMRYCLVTPDGNISFDTSTHHQVRALIGAGIDGEAGLEFVNSLYPVGAYYYVPFDEDTRRMNKPANGMFWELNGPTYADGTPVEDFQPGDRDIKLRGPVAFVHRQGDGLTGDQEEVLRETYGRVVGRLRGRGWL